MRKTILAFAIAALAGLASAQTPVIGATQPNIVFKQAPTAAPPTVATTVYTTPAGSNQVYRACGHVVIATAGSSGGVFPALQYVGSAHTFSNINYINAGQGLSGGTLAVSAQWNSASGCFTFAPDGGTNISLWLGLGGVTGSPAYLYDVTLERLQ